MSTKGELTKLLWEEFKYRHELFWKIFLRAVLAIVILDAAPFLYVKQLSQSVPNSRDLILLPVIAIVLASVAARILWLELKLVRSVVKTYRSIVVSDLKALKRPDTYTVPTGSAGTIILTVSWIASIAISAFAILLIWK